MKKNKLIPLLMLLLCSIFAQAQSAAQPIEMADKMRSDGKIYVVVAVLVIILWGLFAYLKSFEIKLKRIEKSIEENKK